MRISCPIILSKEDFFLIPPADFELDGSFTGEIVAEMAPFGGEMERMSVYLSGRDVVTFLSVDAYARARDLAHYAFEKGIRLFRGNRELDN